MIERLVVAALLIVLGGYITQNYGGLIDLVGLIILVCGLAVGVIAAVRAVKGDTNL